MFDKASLNRRVKYFPAAIFLGAALYLLLRSHVYRPPSTIDFAALEIDSLNGLRLPPTAFKNKPVVLNFWATWCPPCRKEMPWLEDLQSRNPDVVVIGLAYDKEDILQARELAKRSPVKYLLISPNESLSRTFGHLPSVPTTLYISASGRVTHTISGIVPESVMQNYLDDAKRSQ
jgi:thiol-disulfide isomerase/thioredoxin